MREIKFRQRIEYYLFIKGHIPEKDYWYYWGYIDGKFISPKEGYDSDQYTGLKDKNGKEIYEGDIFRVKDEVLEVEWSEDGRFRGYNITNIGCFRNMEYLKNGEVIGNIYKNSELIK